MGPQEGPQDGPQWPRRGTTRCSPALPPPLLPVLQTEVGSGDSTVFSTVAETLEPALWIPSAQTMARPQQGPMHGWAASG